MSQPAASVPYNIPNPSRALVCNDSPLRCVAPVENYRYQETGPSADNREGSILPEQGPRPKSSHTPGPEQTNNPERHRSGHVSNRSSVGTREEVRAQRYEAHYTRTASPILPVPPLVLLPQTLYNHRGVTSRAQVSDDDSSADHGTICCCNSPFRRRSSMNPNLSQPNGTIHTAYRFTEPRTTYPLPVYYQSVYPLPMLVFPYQYYSIHQPFQPFPRNGRETIRRHEAPRSPRYSPMINIRVHSPTDPAFIRVPPAAHSANSADLDGGTLNSQRGLDDDYAGISIILEPSHSYSISLVTPSSNPVSRNNSTSGHR